MATPDENTSTLNADATRPPELSQLWHALHASETQRRLAYSDGALFLVAGDAEREAWERLGLAAVRVEDLPQCPIVHLQNLSAYRRWLVPKQRAELGAPTPPADAPKVAAPPTLPLAVVLVAPGVHPTTFDRPPFEQALRLAHYVWAAEHKASIDLGGVALWCPSSEALAQIKEAAAESGGDFLPLVRKSLACDLRLAETVQSMASAPANLAEARQALAAARQYGAADADIAPQRDAYLDRAEVELVAPLHAAAAGCGDPVDKCLYEGLAELERLSHAGRAAHTGAGDVADEAAAAQLRLIIEQQKIIALLDRRSGHSRRRRGR